MPRVSQTPPFSLGIFLASGLRLLPEHGALRTPSRRPARPLELWSVEGSPFCKIVTDRALRDRRRWREAAMRSVWGGVSGRAQKQSARPPRSRSHAR
eukprot:gene1863-15738_t